MIKSHAKPLLAEDSKVATNRIIPMGTLISELEIKRLSARKISLTEKDFRKYLEAVRVECPPKLIPGNPNIRTNKAMKLIHAFRERYNMGSRVPVEVTESGIFRYRV